MSRFVQFTGFAADTAAIQLAVRFSYISPRIELTGPAQLALHYSYAALQMTHLQDDVLAVDVTVDMRGSNKHFLEALTPQDLLLVAFSKAMQEVTQFDDGTLAVDLAKGFEEQAAFAEAVTVAALYARGWMDSGSAIDALQAAFGKLLDEALACTDDAALSLGKGADDAACLIDALLTAFAKGLTDSVALAEANSLAVGKGFDEAGATQDAFSLQPVKGLADSMAWAEALANALGKTLADIAALAEAPAITSGKALNDPAGFSDSGSLVMVDYAPLNYFAQDYVGTTITF